MDISGYCSLLHLLVTSRDAAVANVIPNGVVEKNSVLGNDTDVTSQRCLLHLRKHNEAKVSSECASKHINSTVTCAFLKGTDF